MMSAATDTAMRLERNIACKLCLIPIRFRTGDTLFPVGQEFCLSPKDGQDVHPHRKMPVPPSIARFRT